MSESVTVTADSKTQEKKENIWGAPFNGGVSPFKISYGKLMMWVFLVSDTFTFGSLLYAYGSTRFSLDYWPNPNEVFSSFFGIPNMPMASVSLMTFILIVSSVTMV
ncbi:MAG TPA: hypothetical protein VK084_07580, partial [Chitinophagaceae bacterium]|nr:hypothetical protein [Chitinophagaceae bacterium]